VRRTRPRHLRHFATAPLVRLDTADHGSARTTLSLVCTDRPGLLADVARVLRRQRLRVHDARIATFGARAEDVFQITDEHDLALTDPQQQRALRDALIACLQGDATQ
jgi:[protein-PII] uridylyltransferase